MYGYEETTPRTLYVGNLDISVTESFLLAIFGSIGECVSCKIIREGVNEDGTPADPYAFIEFREHSAAASALLAMNKRNCLEREMKVNWATSPGNVPKLDTSKHYHVFVGDLSPEIETHQLKDAFKPFGELSDCKIIRDPQSLKSKGYGFVSYVNKEDAESAISSMNGQWLGTRSIRTNWASRKPPAPPTKETSKPLNYDDIFGQASSTNFTVYCGGVINGLTDEIMTNTFSPFGNIQEIRVFKDKGYSFIRYNNKESAAQAIVAINGTEINNQIVKCSWGKEASDPANQTPGSGAASSGSPASGGAASPAGYQANAGYCVTNGQNQYYGGQGGGGYWGYAGAQGYQAAPGGGGGAQNGAYVQPYMQQGQQGYGYQNYGSGGNVQMQGWTGVQMNPQQQYSGSQGQQQGVMGYQMPQGQ